MPRIKVSHYFKVLTILFFLFFLLVTSALALKSVDVNGDGKINAEDLTLVISNWLGSSGASDIDDNGKVNSQDLSFVLSKFGQSVATPTPYPTSPPTSAEWSQHAHDAQRTGYTPEVPAEPWAFLWGWNGPDANGKSSKNFFSQPPDPNDPIPIRDAYSITGGTHVFIPEGKHGLYALAKATNGKMFRGEGDQDWKINSYQGTGLSFNSTPAYESGYVYAAASNGQVFKIQDNGASYSVAGVYSAGSEINKPILSAGDSVYVVTKNGQLHRIRKSDMSAVWSNPYDAGSEAVIPPSYSASRDILIFATRNLFVHAVRNSNGSQFWSSVKPTTHTTSDTCGLYSYDFRWPVIAEKHGIVFIRLRNPWDYNKYPNTNSAIRDLLVNNPGKQSLFALNLDNGAPAFIPAVGPSGGDKRESCSGLDDGLFHAISNAPVVKTGSDGSEKVYLTWRNGQDTQPDEDGRWDSNMGEMALDYLCNNSGKLSICSQTSSNLVFSPGDMRFVNFTGQLGSASKKMISDEIHTISMAGNTIFHHHICSVDIFTINSPESGLGLDINSPIASTRNSVINRSWDDPSSPNSSTHYGDSMHGCGNTRGYDSGFWIYQGAVNPEMFGNPYIYPDLGQEESSTTRYAYVSDGMIIVHGGPRGDLFVLKHN